MTGTDQQAADDWTRGKPLVVGDFALGIYQPSPETAEYWRGVARHELLVRFCPHCSRAFHPKRIVCTACGASDLTWRRATGKGRIYSFSEVHRAPNAIFAASAPYTVGIVRLDEGVYLFTRFFAGRGAIAINAPVRVDFRILETGQLLPVFLVEMPKD